MSDQSQGPGWWEASDDKWYPPELHPDRRPPSEGAAAGRRPATRIQQARWTPWYRRPWVLGGAAALVLLLLAFAVVRGGGDAAETGSRGDGSGRDAGATGTGPADGTGAAGEEDGGGTGRPTLFPARPDRAEQDLEREVGDGAQLAGYTTTVLDTEFRRSISPLETVGYLVVEVRIVNRRDEDQPYNLYDWQLVREDGSTIDPALTTGKNLGSGVLEPGESVTGDVVFEVGDERGDLYIVYKPDLFDAARGIWMTSLPPR